MVTDEIEHQELDICRGLAVCFMQGTRDGSDRPAWRHAEDVAEAVLGYGWIHPEGWTFWGCVAWLHDVIEDCEGLTDETLTQELASSGVQAPRAKEFVRLVKMLTKEKGETEPYFRRIRDSGQWQLSLIKILDRIANLREGKRVFTRRRWSQYVAETEQYVVPLVGNVDVMLREKLLLDLGLAIVGRSSGRRTS